MIKMTTLVILSKQNLAQQDSYSEIETCDWACSLEYLIRSINSLRIINAFKISGRTFESPSYSSKYEITHPVFVSRSFEDHSNPSLYQH